MHPIAPRRLIEVTGNHSTDTLHQFAHDRVEVRVVQAEHILGKHQCTLAEMRSGLRVQILGLLCFSHDASPRIKDISARNSCGV